MKMRHKSCGAFAPSSERTLENFVGFQDRYARFYKGRNEFRIRFQGQMGLLVYRQRYFPVHARKCIVRLHRQLILLSFSLQQGDWPRLQ
jgi:hypothetical protein